MSHSERQKSPTTAATLALARLRIPYTTHLYDHDAAVHDYGHEAATKLGIEPERICKTLIAEIDGRLVVGIVPVSGRLDLKALAMAFGGKHGALADPAEAERKSGYVVGGISPLGQKTPLPTALEETEQLYTTILVSGGRRGFDIEIAPDDLLRATNGIYADIAR